MTNPLESEDMEALERSIASLRSLGGEEIELVLTELDRVRSRLGDITHGKTVLVMSDEDRATRVQDLDDASLAAWSRWVFLNMEQVRERMQITKDFVPDDSDAMTLGAMQGVIGLALLAFGANNTHIEFETKDVTFGDRELGDWQVQVRQIRRAGSADKSGQPVLAEVHSDDRRAEAEFDSRPILAQIDHGWLLDIARCDWGGDKPADDIALMAEKFDDGVRAVLEYMRTAECGFECTMHGEGVMTWLKDNRPDTWDWLMSELEKEGKYQ